MEQIAWIDIITLGLILILAVKGVINGFIKEIFGLIGIVGGIYLATRYANQAGILINLNVFSFGNESSMFLVGFLAVLLGFWLSSILLGIVFSKLLSLSGLGFLDKFLGFLVGGAKIFIIFSIIFVAISNVAFVQEKLNKYLKNSFMYPFYIKTGAYIIDLKPDKLPSFDNKPSLQQDDLQKEMKPEIPANDTPINTENNNTSGDIKVVDENQTEN